MTDRGSPVIYFVYTRRHTQELQPVKVKEKQVTALNCLYTLNKRFLTKQIKYPSISQQLWVKTYQNYFNFRGASTIFIKSMVYMYIFAASDNYVRNRSLH